MRLVLGTIGKVVGTLFLIGICTCAVMACFAVVYVQTIIMPQTKQVLSTSDLFDLNQSSTMYYTDKQTGQQVEMLTLSGSEDRIWVEFKDIPEDLIRATVALEDKRFYKHGGVDWIRTAKGVLLMFTGGDIQGGSTITQQLIKNLTQYDDVTVKRKVLEIFTALEYEKTHSKEDILELYLNKIFLGDGCYGVASAALNYFGKDLQDLTLAECASLISITNNPSVYNPYRHEEKNLERRNLALELMKKQGMISEEECAAAQAEPLDLKRDTGTYREQEIFTWYEDQVFNDVIYDLMDQYKVSREWATELLYSGGLRIETCYDPDVQAYVDAIYRDRTCLELDSKTGQKIQSAITLIDNRTGNVVALAGGIGEKEKSRIFNRATDTVRPPGSSIKPLAVYAPALDMGMVTPATVFDDTPIDLNGTAWPVNSYNAYRGLTTVYTALTNSVNTIAVKVLRDRVTPSLSYQYMTDHFGITTLEPSREINGTVYSDIDLAPLALGGLTRGVSTYEMAAAYATFANNGMYKTPRTYVRVTAVDTNGRETVVLENMSNSDAVLKESTVYYMNTMLQNVITNGTGHDARFQEVPMTIAGKTGTTTSNNDKWFVGYSPYYTAAVWVGYDNQERIPSGAYLAAQMWRKVMEPLHAGLENVGFHQPDNLVSQSYCMDSGMIATEWCSADPRGSRVTSNYFIKGDQPTQYCTVHTPQEVCLDAPILNAEGGPTGMYHAFGPHCPEEKKATVGLLNYDRFRASASLSVADDAYLLSTLQAMENGGLCDVHTAGEPEPEVFDPDDPSTWPVDDPDFDPFDPTTWPSSEPEPGGEDEEPEPSGAPATAPPSAEPGAEPTEDPLPSAGPSEQPEPSTSDSPGDGGDEEQPDDDGPGWWFH